ncbi:DUF4862 family protein [Microbacterium sp. Bi121]|uniref:DUF4862 family protein n=1 Tax=Microbacterium sp. Bi121 TaxID=2822348 RepID=UPI001D766A65|nr:DUF4862 family protein [Microbacterium sp. Bi121]CAH0142239.1 hypothetical protein SRABI121_01036 [Microbacterium sp. Bi121]
MTAPVLVSAYPVSPAFASWDPDLEGELLPAICALDGVAGLEIPWLGGIHKFDDDWFLANVPAVPLAVTPIPFVMGRLGKDAAYGIASTSDAGRRAALADLRRVAADVARLSDESPASVAAVMLYSAPRALQGSAEALARSLDEIVGWNWRGAQLVIEHCDAFVGGQEPEKGFLAVEDELTAIDASETPVGMWLNWGRSAIELREADAVTDQIARVAASGRLAGLALSGAAALESPYGYPWIDAHLPIRSTFPESQSLLDDAHVAAALAAAGDAPWLGLKVARRPDDTTAAAALRTVERNLEVVRTSS